MSAADKALAKLPPRVDSHVGRSGERLTFEPAEEDGFRVELSKAGRGWTVSFDGWHEEFESEEEAASCFAFGLSDHCRLAVTYRGSVPTKWTVEGRQGDEWVPDSTTGLLLAPFWRRRRVVYLQNRLLRAG